MPRHTHCSTGPYITTVSLNFLVIRNFPMKKPLVLSALTLSVAAFACNGSDNNRATDLNQGLVQAGTYQSQHCFKNRIETDLALGAARYSNATITFNADNTGSAVFSTFTDAACQVPTTGSSAVENLTFSSVSAVSDNGVNLIKLEQSGTVLNPTWYIPANISDGGYSLDVDYTDGESGPYIALPSGAQVADFGRNPGQGVSFKKQ
jgi:hypothetical protein